MEKRREKLQQLLLLVEQYRQLCKTNGLDNNPAYSKKLETMTKLAFLAKKADANITKVVDPDTSWKKLFTEAYQLYDQACCAQNLTEKRAKELKATMQKALNKGKTDLKKFIKENPDQTETQQAWQQELDQAQEQLDNSNCDNINQDHHGKHDENNDEFKDHVHDDHHYIDKTANASNFFSLWNGEYLYNKHLSTFLITPEYIESIEQELKQFLEGHKNDIKNLGKDQKTAKKGMEKELQQMQDLLKELKEDKKEALKKAQQESRSLEKEGIADSIQKHKGNIAGYLKVAYYDKFIRAGKDWENNCDNERKKTYLEESMNRLIQQMEKELNDAECLEIVSDGDKAQVKEQLKQMRSAVVQLKQSCVLAGSFLYVITDLNIDFETDNCENLTKFSFDRKVTKIPNPDFKPQTLSYKNIVQQEQTGNTIQYIPNQEKQTALPENAFQYADFDLGDINTYFEANPDATEYLTPISWKTDKFPPMEYIITDGALSSQTNALGMVTQWSAVRTVQAVLAKDCIHKLRWNKLWANQLNSNSQPVEITGSDRSVMPSDAKVPLSTLESLDKQFNGKEGTQTVNLNWQINFVVTQATLNVPFVTGGYDFQPGPVATASLSSIVTILQASPFNSVVLQPRTAMDINSTDPANVALARNLIAGRRTTLINYFNSLGLGAQIRVVVQPDSYFAPIEVRATITQIQ